MNKNNMPQKQYEDVLQDNKFSNINSKEKEIILLLQDYLNEDFFSWKYKKPYNLNNVNKEQFKLPESLIDIENQKEMFLIKLPEFNEFIPRTKLNKVQLKTLKKTGTFQVQSRIFSMDYTWKISGVLYQGSNKRKWNYQKMLAYSYKFLLDTWRTFSFQKFLFSLDNNKLYAKNIFLGLFHIFIFMLNLIEFLVGLPYYYYSSQSVQILQEKLRQIQTEKIMRQNFLNNKELFQKLLSQDKDNNDYYKELNDFTQYYQQQWDIYRQQQIDAIDDTDEQFYQEQVNQIDRQKVQFINNCYLNDELFFQDNQNLKKILLNKYFNLQIQEELNFSKSEELNKEINNIHQRIKQTYPIKSKIQSWYNQYYEKELKNYQEQLDDKYDNLLVSKLEENNLYEEKELYQMLKQTKQEVYELQRKQILNQELVYKFKTLKNKFIRPGKVKQIKKRKHNQSEYYLESYETKKIFLKYPFWRLIYWFSRLFYHTKNLFIKTLRIAFLSQWGLKGLISCDYYYLQYSCDKKTGKLTKNKEKQTPIGKRFQKVLRGIQKSRQTFEDEERQGLFGKNLSRFFNYIECYFFRLFIVGILYVIIIRPIINIFVFLFFILISLTALLWIILKLILFTLLKIFIYDFDYISFLYYFKEDIPSWHHQFFYNKKLFPIFKIIGMYIFYGIIQLIHCFLIICLFPIISLLIFIWANIRYLFRFLLDSFVFYLIIKPFAKIPERDSFEVQKIEGPGTSNNLFFTLSIEDCVQLLIQLLEIKRLDRFQEIVLKELRSPKENLEQKCHNIFNKFNFEIKFDIKNVQQSITIFENILKNQIQKQKKLLQSQNFVTGYYKIKFTDEQLRQLIGTTEEILKNNLEKFDLQDYIWKVYDVKKGYYKRLTSNVIQELFPQSFDIFESIENYEQQLILKDHREHIQKLKYFKKALKGQLFTNHENKIIYRQKENKEKNYTTHLNIMSVFNSIQVFKKQFLKYQNEISQ